MWDNETPLKLLSTMPNTLEDKHLEKLQMLLEADKYKNQLVSGLDLCGTYAPFCDGCNKVNKYPCATAYINYLKTQGIDIQIDTGTPDEEYENSSETVNTGVEENTTESEDISVNPEYSAEEDVLPEEPANAPEENEEMVEEVKPEYEPDNTEEQPKKIKIRIATARKKTLL